MGDTAAGITVGISDGNLFVFIQACNRITVVGNVQHPAYILGDPPRVVVFVHVDADKVVAKSEVDKFGSHDEAPLMGSYWR